MPILGVVASSAKVTGSYDSIATAYPNGQSVQFASIPTAYRHLQLRIFSRASTGTNNPSTGIRINGAQNVYSLAHLGFQNGSFSQGFDFATYRDALAVNTLNAGATANTFGMLIVDIYDYRNSVTTKTLISYGGYGDSSAQNSLMRWNFRNSSTDAINQLDLIMYNPDTTFANGSVVALYGMKGS